MRKPSLFERFAANLKGGEEKTITRFEVKMFDRLEREVSNRKTKIADLKEHITDAQSSLNDAVFAIDTDKIKTIDEAKAYTTPYLNNLQTIMKKIEGYEEQIETLQSEIECYNKISSVIDKATAPSVKEK